MKTHKILFKSIISINTTFCLIQAILTKQELLKMIATIRVSKKKKVSNDIADGGDERPEKPIDRHSLNQNSLAKGH